MEWKELAPWITIAITLALSILVPLFTQIANNKFQIKIEKEKFEKDIEQKSKEAKRQTYESFIKEVGECIGHAHPENLKNAIASIHKLYIYCPISWWGKLDVLSNEIVEYDWTKALMTYREIVKMIAEKENAND